MDNFSKQQRRMNMLYDGITVFGITFSLLVIIGTIITLIVK